MAHYGVNGANPHWFITGLVYPANHFANWTVHFFAKPDSAISGASGRFFAGIIGSSTQNPHMQFPWDHPTSAFQKSATNRASGGTYTPAKLTSSPSTGVWYSMCGTYDGTNVKGFYNGSQEASAASGAINSARTTRISVLALGLSNGGFDTSGQSNLDASMAEFAAWNVALSADEIVALSKGFRATKIRPASLQFYMPMVRDAFDVKGTTLTESNGPGTIVDHPRVYG